jgi:hypothetical protein
MNPSGTGGSIYCVMCGKLLPKRLSSHDNTCAECHADPKRPLGLDEVIPDQGWRAYRVACTQLGYTYPQCTSPAETARFDAEWTWWLRIGAFANFTHNPEHCKGDDWAEAEAAFNSGAVDSSILQMLRYLP